MNKSKSTYWKTTNFYLAAFLFGRGAIVVGVESTVERRAIFTFIDSLEREEWVNEFRSGTPLIDVRIYIYALEALKQKRFDSLIEQSHGEE